ncbi:MAG TPA: VanZ family protein [Brumimicrobium sp.]|nr:VanZ family protein [Brumimicrobium sp.]
MLRFILPSILWTILIIILSLAPSSDLDLVDFKFEGADKIVHFVMYTLLSLFWSIGLKRQNVSKFLYRRAFLISVFGSFFLSFILELLQEFFTLSRNFDALDLIANGIGCIFGVLIFKILYKGVSRVE